MLDVSYSKFSKTTTILETQFLNKKFQSLHFSSATNTNTVLIYQLSDQNNIEEIVEQAVSYQWFVIVISFHINVVS